MRLELMNSLSLHMLIRRILRVVCTVYRVVSSDCSNGFTMELKFWKQNVRARVEQVTYIPRRNYGMRLLAVCSACSDVARAFETSVSIRPHGVTRKKYAS
jgi:hypothetical protein